MDSLAAFQLNRWFSAGFAEQNPEMGERLLDVFRSNDLDHYAATCRAMGAMDLRALVPAITAPTTVIVGAQDPATDAELLRQLIPDTGLHVIPRCSHLSAVERPDAIARLLEADLFTRI